MKKQYTIFITLLISLTGFSQNYQFGIVHNGDYNFSVVATPDFDVTDSDVSDIGFALMLPAGDVDVTNLTPFNGRVWSATQVTEAQFAGAGIDSNGRDGFAMNLPPGQTILSHTNGTPFVLVSFEVSNMPMEGLIEILLNTDPIALGLGGSVDSFYNSNIDNTTTSNYFNGLTLGQEDFSFDTLSVEEVDLNDESISLYPNPTIDFIHIKTQHQINGIAIYNLIGKLVLTTTNKSISLKHLKSGTYLVQIETDKGKTTRKIIIK